VADNEDVRKEPAGISQDQLSQKEAMTTGTRTPAPSHSPPHIFASEFSVSLLPHAMYLTFGHVRMLIPQTGDPRGEYTKEWLHTLVLPHPTFLALVQALEQARPLVEQNLSAGALKINVIRSDKPGE
jgi:hypothetical protein